MSDLEIIFYTFIVVASVGSYYYGHKHGISNTVTYLENEGLIEYEEDKWPQ